MKAKYALGVFWILLQTADVLTSLGVHEGNPLLQSGGVLDVARLVTLKVAIVVAFCAMLLRAKKLWLYQGVCVIYTLVVAWNMVALRSD